MKTSQLQIRVSPRQKAAIRALARKKDMDVSAFVLSRVLGEHNEEFARLVQQLKSSEGSAPAFAELHDYLHGLSTQEFSFAVGQRPAIKLSDFVANYLAAMVEEAARQKNVSPPSWVREIEPLQEPAFGSELKSLRLHLLVSSPPTFRRRNIFIDSSIGARV